MSARCPAFLLRRDPVAAARRLLGSLLITEIDGLRTSGRIVETEAYGGPEDRASHAHGNRRTPRTDTMFLPGGHAYVYLCYGLHHLFNIVIGPADWPAAVLIRALEPVDGIDLMRARRRFHGPVTRLAAGPGTLTRALGITRSHDRLFLDRPPLWIEPSRPVSASEIAVGPRIGVDYAGPHALWPRRFWLKNHPSLNHPNQSAKNTGHYH
jgi:DNA-3-methyladenine glycosylase